MLVLDHVRRREWPELFLALYHRGHLSLVPGTTVHVIPVIRPDRRTHLIEFFGTTISFESWMTVYRVGIVVDDNKGVLNIILKSLADYGINILHLDASSMEQESLFEVEMVVDFMPDGKAPSSIDADRSLEIEGLILSQCYSIIAIAPDNRPRLRVRPIHSFRDAYRNHMSLRGPGVTTPSTLIVAKEGRLGPKEHIEELLKRAFSARGASSNQLPEQYCLHPQAFLKWQVISLYHQNAAQ